MKKKTFLILLLIFVISGCGNKNTNTQDQVNGEQKKAATNLAPSQINNSASITATSTNKISDEVNQKTVHGKNENQNVKGSCTNIDKTSTCTEYVGDFWTTDQIKTSCKNIGQISTESCDNDFIGGCNIASGTSNESTIWYYGRGEAKISGTAIKNLEKLCNRNPKAKWISK